MYSGADLAAYVNLGRTPVREALQRLIREELVVTRKNRGIFISPIDVIRQLQLLDVRHALEQLLAAHACEPATEQERREMMELATAREESATRNDAGEFLRLNRSRTLLTFYVHSSLGFVLRWLCWRKARVAPGRDEPGLISAHGRCRNRAGRLPHVI